MSDIGAIRSDFLIHWTGKDIERKYNDPKSIDIKREKYICRLKTTLDLEKGGLWITDSSIRQENSCCSVAYVYFVCYSFRNSCLS